MQPNVICILCGQANNVTVDLYDGASLHCHECDEDFTPADVTAFINGWVPLLSWLSLHPAAAPTKE